MLEAAAFETPRVVGDPEGCRFYHTMTVPGLGTMEGDWDLRAGVDDYLGNIDFGGKRVLELGPASGFLSFEMERRGADVVAYDLPVGAKWDVVPYATADLDRIRAERNDNIRRVQDAFWLAHRAFESNVRVVYGTVYEVPDWIGEVDVSVFGSILLHLRDPFLALERALRLTRETAVVTDVLSRPFVLPAALLDRVRPSLGFRPDFRRREPFDSWWSLTPGTIKAFLGVLGFERTTVGYHTQLYRGRKRHMYTVVGTRTTGRAGT